MVLLIISHICQCNLQDLFNYKRQRITNRLLSLIHCGITHTAGLFDFWYSLSAVIISLTAGHSQSLNFINGAVHLTISAVIQLFSRSQEIVLFVYLFTITIA